MKHLTKEELMEENYYTSEDKYWMKGGITGTCDKSESKYHFTRIEA